MAKEIIFYNLKDGVREEDYIKWCETYKGPLLLGQSGVKSFILLKMMGGITGNGQKGVAPGPSDSPYRFIGILDASTLESIKNAHETKSFKDEFFPQWFSKWVADFYVLVGTEVYQRVND